LYSWPDMRCWERVSCPFFRGASPEQSQNNSDIDSNGTFCT
jgi:hypothetical protein